MKKKEDWKREKFCVKHSVLSGTGSFPNVNFLGIAIVCHSVRHFFVEGRQQLFHQATYYY